MDIMGKFATCLCISMFVRRVYLFVVYVFMGDMQLAFNSGLFALIFAVLMFFFEPIKSETKNLWGNIKENYLNK